MLMKVPGVTASWGWSSLEAKLFCSGELIWTGPSSLHTTRRQHVLVRHIESLVREVSS
jgi:hypothetical protein